MPKKECFTKFSANNYPNIASAIMYGQKGKFYCPFLGAGILEF